MLRDRRAKSVSRPSSSTVSRRRCLASWGAAAATAFATSRRSAAYPLADLPLLPLRSYAAFLKGASGRTLQIGVSPEGGDWADSTGIPAAIARREFNRLVNHGITMMATYRARRQWDFSYPDLLMQTAEAWNQRAIGMHLVWGSDNPQGVPDWILQGGYSRDELIAIMEEHIVAVMTRYKGRIDAYTVVNEKYNGRGVWDWWYQHVGPDYDQVAFSKAREVDPSAILIYNHFDNETTQGYYYGVTKGDVDALRARGLVDAVGVQMHMSLARPSKADVLEGLRSYGLPVWCTEFDSFQLRNVTDPSQEQGIFTQNMVEAILESEVCDCLTTWGISDKNSFWNTYYGVAWRPCLWDDGCQPKPNYIALRDALAKQVGPLAPTYLPALAR